MTAVRFHVSRTAVASQIEALVVDYGIAAEGLPLTMGQAEVTGDQMMAVCKG